MDFDLSKPQKLLKQSARDFLARECKPADVRRIQATETAHDEKLWRAAADQGWTGLIVDEEYGGLGLGIVELAVVAEEMGRACMPGPLLSTMFASAVIGNIGSEEQKKRWLEPIAAGEIVATMCGSDNPVWALPGRQTGMSVAHGGFADVILRVQGEEVRVYAKGLTARRTPSMDETRKWYDVTFDGAEPIDMLRGSIDRAVDIATVVLCAEMVGGMQWVLDTTVDYAKTRQQFGRAIGSFQAVQHHCADMLLLTESSRTATYYAAWALTNDAADARVATSMAKAYCSDACREVGNKGIQVHGGIGFTWEHDLQLYYRRAKASEILFGDATFHRERIATLVIDRSAGAPLPKETSNETLPLVHPDPGASGDGLRASPPDGL